MIVITQFEKKPLIFKDHESIISCTDLCSIAECFKEIERALESGYYVAGFLSYESGYGFEEKLRVNKSYDFPLIQMGVYKHPQSHKISAQGKHACGELKDLRLSISQGNYSSDIQAIREYIAQGDVYQITYCLKLLFTFTGDPFAFYSKLLKEQPVPYPAYIETDKFHILSLSPEMFVQKTACRIVTKPMKGTWQRGSNPIFDLLAKLVFQNDLKNKAENLMIADLLRNDINRIGFDIRAPRLFEVARYRTLFQMTSTVTGQVDKNIPLYQLFASIFPSGSVTGAPKIRAMEIIRELETQERKIYTGAIGYITPEKDLFFNVPIRTLLIQDRSGEMGIGGGIVWDSTSQGEWAEGLLKARFLTCQSSTPLGIKVP
jgi:para-aminobenzoate synthetase / 4-amino-4-deoxychorismate lyase